jgi:16S rRNA (uracil1498-N3)-methyltransferase
MSTPIANTYRFFVPPSVVQGTGVVLTDGDLVHQLGRVLRLRPGDSILLLDGSGCAYTVRLTAVERGQVCGDILETHPAGGEPSCVLTLYLPLLRGERFEWVLQKGTELGVAAFVPVVMQHSQAARQAGEHKGTRWQRILREAAEQACRGTIPTLSEPLPFDAACAAAAQTNLPLLLWEGAQGTDTPLLRTVLRQSTTAAAAPTSLALLSGPEGGITPEELTWARTHGIMPVSLGPRILRAETAPIAAAAAIFYEFEAYGA